MQDEGLQHLPLVREEPLTSVLKGEQPGGTGAVPSITSAGNAGKGKNNKNRKLNGPPKWLQAAGAEVNFSVEV